MSNTVRVRVTRNSMNIILDIEFSLNQYPIIIIEIVDFGKKNNTSPGIRNLAKNCNLVIVISGSILKNFSTRV